MVREVDAEAKTQAELDLEAAREKVVHEVQLNEKNAVTLLEEEGRGAGTGASSTGRVQLELFGHVLAYVESELGPQCGVHP